MTFVAYYVDFGDLPKVGEKAGFVCREAVVTKEKNGIVFFKVDGETGERKIKQTELNRIRDFGNSLYGVFEKDLILEEALDLIYISLTSRVTKTENIKIEINTLMGRSE